MKNYRYFGDEMEILGNRLDHARKCAANSKSAWALKLLAAKCRTALVPMATVTNFTRLRRSNNYYSKMDSGLTIFMKKATMLGTMALLIELTTRYSETVQTWMPAGTIIEPQD
jgi:hypothetical protein